MTPATVKASYRRAIDQAGEPLTVRRYTGAGASRPRVDVSVRGRVVDYRPDELVGTIQQGDRMIILLVEDLVAAQFPMPLRKGDKIVVRGRELNIEDPDDNTRRVAGVLIAYELRARG
ncbi:MAG: hypothetical protein AB7F22_10615 [Reyranella sp.]|uniref:hypothetical protein n=1 Tax=Reyranella sp. TaxID=1929291 RepID=UPI003D14553F